MTRQELKLLVGHSFMWFDPPPQYGSSGLIVEVTRIKDGDASPYPIEAVIKDSGYLVQCKPEELRPLTCLERRAAWVTS